MPILDDNEGINEVNLNKIKYTKINQISYPTGFVSGIKVTDNYILNLN